MKEIFDIVAGSASIVALIISLVTLNKVVRISAVIVDKSKKSPRQSIDSKEIRDASIVQVGGDNHVNSSS